MTVGELEDSSCKIESLEVLRPEKRDDMGEKDMEINNDSGDSVEKDKEKTEETSESKEKHKEETAEGESNDLKVTDKEKLDDADEEEEEEENDLVFPLNLGRPPTIEELMEDEEVKSRLKNFFYILKYDITFRFKQ